MSGSRWVITPSWLSGSWKSFCIVFCVFLPPILHIFCFCKVHTISVVYCAIFAWNISLESLIFLKRSLVFPILLLSSISLHWSLRKAFLSLLLFFGTLHSNGYIFPFLLCLWLLFYSQLFVRPPQAAVLTFYSSFSWGWSWSLLPVQCHEPLSIVLQHFIRYNPLKLFVTSTV